MNRILPIIRKEFIHILRDRRALMIAFLTPVIQMVILGYAATTDVRNVPLAVLDQDRTRQSRALIDAFVQSGQFTVYRYVMSERDLAAQIDSGQARAGLIIPPDYGRTVTAGRDVGVVFVLDGSDPSVASNALSSARLIGVALATRVREETLARRGATTTLMPGVPQVRERVWYNPDMDSAVFMVPGLIGLVLQFQATLLTASAVVRERERGTIEQLIVTPIRPYELMLGKILPYAVIELLVVGEVLLVGTLWFGVPIRGSLILLVAIACLFLVSTLALGLLISTIAHTQFEAFQLSFLTLLPSVFISGFIYPIDAMPAALQLISKIIPLTYFLVVVRGIIIKGVGIEALLPQIAALTIFGAALLTIASLRFRKRLD
ncbi:ABC transporter permease [Roseiflexus sp. RS-1]|uniref:ABC transporter permease n=1 Tax=Roseiflexus sp. (strain RS-1) TaxID=357808 RepID=UPI0001533F46|nr:ABC transporter permease [Roseiflexus sp. RS-1]ABQ90856.1 ABC-2 type transporter [Roseiflexus sp. RS-1]